MLAPEYYLDRVKFEEKYKYSIAAVRRVDTCGHYTKSLWQVQLIPDCPTCVQRTNF
jgi:hypothetical protein